MKITIGVPKEIKQGETRVALTPSVCRRCTGLGARVLIERGAGLAAGFADVEYSASGATFAESAEQLWKEAELVLKVKEPLPVEFERMQPGQTLFTYLHLAAGAELADALCARRILAVAYETVEAADRSLPLLKPMSQIAGRLAIQAGAFFLQSQNGGSGVLLGGVPGTGSGHVAVIGAGNSGAHAVRMAMGLGARVSVLDLDVRKLEALDAEYGGRVFTLIANPANIGEAVGQSDLVVGAVLVPATKAPVIVTRSMVAKMRPGSVVVDIAVDQGGCVETTRPTSHEKPVFMEEGVVHYAVPNMPASVGRTSTLALTQATEPYVVEFATKGIDRALDENPGLAKGINTRSGVLTNSSVAAALGRVAA